MPEKNKEIEALKSQLEEMRERLENVGSTVRPEVTQEVRQYVDSASAALKDYIDQTAQVVKEKWETAQDMGAKTGKKVAGYAKENPWHVIAAAALVGVAIASLVHTVKDKE